MEADKINVSIRIPKSLHNFLMGRQLEVTKMKTSSLCELLLEKHLKENNLWEEYQQYLLK
jgi:hypothetical protein